MLTDDEYCLNYLLYSNDSLLQIKRGKLFEFLIIISVLRKS